VQYNVVHCFVTRTGPNFTFTASALERTYCQATFGPSPEQALQVLSSAVLPTLTSLKRQGYELGIQFNEDTEQVWLTLGFLLGEILDGFAQVVPVSIPPPSGSRAARPPRSRRRHTRTPFNRSPRRRTGSSWWTRPRSSPAQR